MLCGIWNQTAWVQISAWPLCHVTLSKRFTLGSSLFCLYHLLLRAAESVKHTDTHEALCHGALVRKEARAVGIRHYGSHYVAPVGL